MEIKGNQTMGESIKSLGMDFLDLWRQISGLTIRAFARCIGWEYTRLRASIADENPKQREYMRGVCLARRAARQTWVQAGKQLDQEFLTKADIEDFEKRLKAEQEKRR